MTTEERFERIERALSGIVEAQNTHVEMLKQMMQMFGEYMDSADRRMTRTEDGLRTLEGVVRELEAAVRAFLESADRRMSRIEENLEALIRAITSEHSNGKGSSLS